MNRCWRARAATLALVLVWQTMPVLAETPPFATRLPRTNLLAYHNPQGQTVVGKSKSDWQKRRQEVLQGMQAVMGPLPGKEKRCPLAPTVQEEVDCGACVRRLITYAAEPGGRAPAYLLVPKSALSTKKKYPGVLVLHPTDAKYGHRVTVELLRNYYRTYARDLAERGFVVLAPAYPLMADYQPDLKALGYQSGTMKAIWDNIRGLDFLESLPYVKPRSYGALGHSLGGHNAIFTAVFEPRLTVVVSSCGFDSFLDYYAGDASNWQPGLGWCQERYMPKLTEYRTRLQDIPFDFYELLGALAPRPVFINAPLRDANFGSQSVDRIISAALPVYRLYGRSQYLQVAHPDCEHDFPPDVREQAYRFLALHLHAGIPEKPPQN